MKYVIYGPAQLYTDHCIVIKGERSSYEISWLFNMRTLSGAVEMG